VKLASGIAAPWRVLAVGALLGVLTPTRVYPDSINYMNSGTSLFTSAFAADYFWLREPLYPLLLRIVLELPPGVTIHLLPAAQGLALGAGFWLFALVARDLGLLRRPEMASYYAFTCLLVLGYTGAVLQQTLVILAASALAWCTVRLAIAPIDRRIIFWTSISAALAVLLSAIFLVAVALVPVATVLNPHRGGGRRAAVSIWGSGGLAIGLWTLVRLANGQPFGLGGAAVLDRTNTTDWPLRIQAFLATFGLAPDFYDGVHFNVLSYSNVALGLRPYFGGTPCVDADLVDLTTMPDTYLVCGSTLAPALSQSLLQPVTTYALVQVIVGVFALVWAWCRTRHLALYAGVLAITIIPCLPVAVFLADGNSRYGLPVLALSLVLTAGMAEHAVERTRTAFAGALSRQRIV